MIQTPHTWIEINKAALEHNIALYKKMIGTSMLGIVVKSNAYGHGIVEIARICQQSPHADWLFTATLSEALLLRNNGITKPILVIYFIDADPTLALEHDIELMVSDLATLTELNSRGIAAGKKFNIHLKIDSGMSRFGFSPDCALIIVKKILEMSGLTLTGIYSHLAQAANPDCKYCAN
jgi:alanine racemase